MHVLSVTVFLPMHIRILLPVLLFLTNVELMAQQRPADAAELVRNNLVTRGVALEDLREMRLADAYVDAHNGVRHTWFRQQWMGIDVYNTEITLHQRPDGSIIHLGQSLAAGLAKKAVDATPGFTPADALTRVLIADGHRFAAPPITRVDGVRHTTWFSGAPFGGQEAFVELMWLRSGDDVRLVWNVNYAGPKGDHWWNVRLDARTGDELERNDWVAECAFDDHGATCSGEAPIPAAPNDYNVYPAPVESPIHGARSIRNAPWSLAPNASPYGWHDTNGANGAEYTITRGNNVLAQEDADANNGSGYSPDGGASLDFDFPINLANAPITYRDASITNLFYWNNIIHDVWYQYGFDEVSGNFQNNNYGNGGAGNDYVLADAQDGGGTNNANFGTPADGSSPRMQMYLWTSATPSKDGDLDNGIIAHEYGHGISNRLIGGPSNVNCMGNAEQMGEGWSDWFGLMMTMEPGDAAADARGIGTFAISQAPTGVGIRPAPYSTNFSVNSYTYANTNSGLSQPHGIGFVWCTMLWEMTWDLIALNGFDPDLYNGTGGNNIAMQLVIDGLKLTVCNPGFVDGRDAILQADMADFGGAHQNLIWAAFARRGLGFSASQGSSASRTDQVEAYNLPVNNSVGILDAVNPTSGTLNECASSIVSMRIRNTGLLAQSGFSVSYQLDGGQVMSEAFTGTLAPSGIATHTFATPLPALSVGAHSIILRTVLNGDQYVTDDQLTLNFANALPSAVPFTEDLESGAAVPAGWRLENPDNAGTWTNVSLANGALCATSKAWQINYYSYNAPRQQDRLISPVVNLAGSAGSRLRFHHAYVEYSSSYVDSLRVQVSTDCGGTWTTLWQAWAASLATAPINTSSWTPSACSQWQLHDLDISAYDGQKMLVRFVGVCGYGNNLYLDNVAVVQNGVRVALSLLLEGPLDPNTGLMRDDLRASALIPITEPYTTLSYTQAADGGGEVVQSGVLARTGNDAIVDWVQVELRDATTPTTVVATRPALLQRDGDVVSEDGTSAVSLLAAADNYYVAVRHRNHLGCMSALPLALSGTSTTLDLRSSTTVTYGADARKQIGGLMALWAGNVLRIQSPSPPQIQYTGGGNDRDPILVLVGGTTPNATDSGYRVEDVNLDGATKYTGSGNDRDPILVNVGSTTPNNVRVEQLP